MMSRRLALALAAPLLLAASASATTVKAPVNCATRPCVYTHTCATGTCSAGEVTELKAAVADAELGDTVKCEGGKVYPIAAWEITARAGTPGVCMSLESSLLSRLPEAMVVPEQSNVMCQFEGTGAESVILLPAHTSPVDEICIRGIRFRLATGNNLTHQNGLLRAGGRAAESYTVDGAAETLAGGQAAWLPNGTEMSCNAGLGIDSGTNYFIVQTNGTTFKLSLTPGGAPVDLTSGAAPCRAQWLGAWQPGGIELDRILVNTNQPQAFSDNQVLGRGILLDARGLTLKRSWIDDVANGADSQGALIASGSGYVIENNYFGGATENLMSGGTPKSIYNPSFGGRVEGNIFAKPIRWRQQAGWEAATWYELGALRKPVDLSAVFLQAQNSGTSGGAEPTWPALGATVVDNEITWKRISQSFSTKNLFETKDAANLLLIRNGLYWSWIGAQQEAIVLKPSSLSSGFQESPPFRSGTVNTSGTVVTWVSGDALPFQPGAASVVWDQITIAGTDIDIDMVTSGWTTNGGSDLTLTLLSIPVGDPLSGAAFAYGDPSDNHQLAEMHDLIVAFNHLRHVPAVTWAPNRGHVQRGHVRNIQYVGNLASDVGVDWGAGVKNLFNLNPHDGFRMLHNTVVRSSTPDVAWAMQVAGGWVDGAEIRDNILAGAVTGVEGTAAGMATVTQYFCDGGACGINQWDKNVFAGGATSTYTVGTHWNLCPTTASCASPDYATLFENLGAQDFRVVSTHAGFQGGSDGLSIGADPRLVPDIAVRAEVGDTSAILKISPTAGVRNFPCVARVSTARDLRALIADQDLSQGPGWAAANADNQAGSPAGAERVIPIGIRNALTPSTTYYYGVYCGGAQLDVPGTEVYSFTTLAALAGTGTISVNGEPTTAGTDDRVIQWGTSYDRATDAIQSPVLGTGQACTTAVGCTVNVTTNRGDLIYYRTLDRDIGDSVLESGPVQMAVVL